ncbi:MAG: hypothetical protein A2Y62_14115 [Candidatus Fischerbacteria bacterium RBG_13_37_8]|uniref:Nucleoside phosphorylase domain-containing protein n=1 Tax=Candidatus Fischerbacteria bacterium RBG_13_37_8 TaxID=1817863 RepID=A0A1F5VH49_9BACT|nr:MAG: hypothetical protein A2Y62_14115 [Candidatus Fischerbacteria bacterium RBG_13_37_8]
MIPSKIEYDFISNALQELQDKECSKSIIKLFRTGVGKKAGRTITRNLSYFQNSLLILTGTAGALGPELKPGDIFIPNMIRSVAPAKELFTFNVLSLPCVLSFITGTMITISTLTDQQKYNRHKHTKTQSVRTDTCVRPQNHKAIMNEEPYQNEKKLLHQHYNASAVDMESFILLKICREYHLNMLIVKVILDAYNESIGREKKEFFLFPEDGGNDFSEEKRKLFIERLETSSRQLAQIIHSICIQQGNMLESYDYEVSKDA